jgi:tetratricopeptide (TPR) repeat protein
MPKRGSSFRTSLLVALLLSGPAVGADRAGAGRLDEIDAQATGLIKDSDRLRRNFTERSGLIGVAEARERYEDALYLFLLKDYEAAATSFYILVQSRSLGNMDLARDSEWYLAECLFELGNYRTAEEAYRSIAEKGTQHPYFSDSVRRLLEVYGILGDVERFDRYYNDFIISGKVPATELINYTLAKSFYRRGEFNRAKSMFDALPGTSPYYGRSRYFLGVLMIREKNERQAIAEFEKVEVLVPTDPDQQQVQELARLALARLHYEIGEFTKAETWYSKIANKSPYFADQLYESVWASIKQANAEMVAVPTSDQLRKLKPEDLVAASEAGRIARDRARARWEVALRQVGIFLDNYPDHRYAADLKLLQGHLLMKLEKYEEARIAYERVVDEYTPLVARLDAVNSTDQLRRLLEGATGGDAGVSEKLPPFALGALRGDSQVARAAEAWREVEEQKAEIAASERIVKDLEAALSGGGDVLGTFLTARQEVNTIRGSTLSMRDALLETEANWLRSRAPALRADLAQFQKDRSSVLATLSQLGASAEASSERVAAHEEQVNEVQQRAFRTAQVAQEVKADAARTMELVGQSNKLSLVDADKVRSDIVGQQRELDAVIAELQSLQGEVVERRVMRSVLAGTQGNDSSQRATLLSRYADLRKRIVAFRSGLSDADSVAFFQQSDRVWASLEALDTSTEETSRVIATAEAREVGAVRTRLAREAQRVVELRRDVEVGSASAESIALRAVRTGIRRLEGEFRADVLEADKGIVDVYWLRKSAASDQLVDLGEEKNRLLEELDGQFRIVRENLE